MSYKFDLGRGMSPLSINAAITGRDNSICCMPVTPLPWCFFLLIPEIFLLVKQVRPRTTQIYNLRAPISIFFQSRTLEAVERIRDPFAAADDTFVLIVAEAAFVADADEGGGAHVGVAYWAFAVAFVAEAADGDAGLLAAHDEIRVMAGHDEDLCAAESILMSTCSKVRSVR